MDFSNTFGKIDPPKELAPFHPAAQSGAEGISKFLSNFVNLIYALAAVVLIFMLLWGAYDWLTSGGEKEKVEQARQKITHSLIGIVIFAAAFGLIKVLGKFTGFKFFVGQ